MNPQKKLIAIRASDMTRAQLEDLQAALGLNQTEVLTLAIDRLHESEIRRKIKNINSVEDMG